MISLAKGERISLAKAAPGLKRAMVGLGWSPRRTDGRFEFDLDASVLLVDGEGKCQGIQDFCFYNNKSLYGGAVTHDGDNRDGQGDGDDERIRIEFEKIPAHIKKLVIVVTIHEANQRGQNFGQVEDAYVRLVDEETGEQVLRYDLTEDSSVETALIFAEINRREDGWSFAARGEGKTGGLQAICSIYGLDAS